MGRTPIFWLGSSIWRSLLWSTPLFSKANQIANPRTRDNDGPKGLFCFGMPVKTIIAWEC